MTMTARHVVAPNPPLRKGEARASRCRKRPGRLVGVVHYGAIWFNRSLSERDLKRVAGALLDAGIPVNGYWADCDYANIDPRISSKDGRV
jgi:hypothetical protein